MGIGDQCARELLDELGESTGAPAIGHLASLNAIAEDAEVKPSLRRRAVVLIAAIEGEEAVSTAVDLVARDWMDAFEQGE